ncbi:hypothetical protein GJAV_G00273370 [Gymnothorax javanicus]|nr:hypothetical protein GJAV_G00273370 [Gymnothorax javanicus]
MVERVLVSLNQLKPQTAAETFQEVIRVTPAYSHTMQLIRSSYLELAGLYLLQWEQSSCRPQDQQSPAPPRTPKEQRSAGWQRARVALDRPLTERELLLLQCWVCITAANQVSLAHIQCSQLSSSMADQQPPDKQHLPNFAISDLLGSREGVESTGTCSSSPLVLQTAGPECSGITWVHLLRYHRHILHLHNIATSPVTERIEGLCSVVLGNTLAQRLRQLHTLFCSLLPSYRGRCCPPEHPTALLQPHSTQSADGEDTLAWACAEKQQLCLQWHRPPLDPSQENQNTVLLTFAFNQAPLSALKPTPGALAQLRCGQLRVPLDRLTAAHADLCSLCAEASVSSPPKSSRKPSRTPETQAPPDPALQERSMQCCAEVRALLLGNREPAALSEVPFEPSLQDLCDLEHCLNPGGGACLSGGALIQWLASLLL